MGDPSARAAVGFSAYNDDDDDFNLMIFTAQICEMKVQSNEKRNIFKSLFLKIDYTIVKSS